MTITKFSHRLNFVALLCVLFLAHGKAQNVLVSGRVTCSGKALVNVVVTDGKICVATDKKGFYSISTSKNTQFIYLSTPAGYLPPDSMKVPRFYKRTKFPAVTTYHFDLKKNPQNDLSHTLLVHADPQFYKDANFEHYKRVVDDCKTTIRESENQDVFGIDCGDLVGDKPELYAKYIDNISKTDVLFYRALGNHDMNYGGRSDETSTARYNHIFGPAYYSFNKGKVHYIILDNVFYLGRDYFYMGYLTEGVLHWLEQDLSYVPKGSTVFVAMHIPARLTDKSHPFRYNGDNIAEQTINVSALFQLLEPYQAHILTGHMHYNRNIIHSPTIYEHNTGAICGTWWQGDYCLDGTPIGYGVYEITENNVKWHFKSVGQPRSHQFRAYPPGSLAEYPDDVLVNVWNWDRNWKIEWFENEVKKGEMTRFEAIDPEVVKMCADKDKLEFKWISPIKTDHIFRATPENKKSEIKIVVTDCFGNQYTEKLKQK